MSHKLSAAHEGFGDGDDHKTVVGGQSAAGETCREHPVGGHGLTLYSGKTVYGKSAIIQRFKDFWRDAQRVQHGNGVAFLGDDNGRDVFRGHAAL